VLFRRTIVPFVISDSRRSVIENGFQISRCQRQVF